MTKSIESLWITGFQFKIYNQVDIVSRQIVVTWKSSRVVDQFRSQICSHLGIDQLPCRYVSESTAIVSEIDQLPYVYQFSSKVVRYLINSHTTAYTPEVNTIFLQFCRKMALSSGSLSPDAAYWGSKCWTFNAKHVAQHIKNCMQRASKIFTALLPWKFIFIAHASVDYLRKTYEY